MKLYENGAYLVNGRDVVINSPEAASAVNAKTGKTVTPEDAKKQTIAYGILKSHNTSGNMEKLQIKFDKLTGSLQVERNYIRRKWLWQIQKPIQR